MYCTLVFDNLNDIIYKHYDKKFYLHLRKIGLQQGLISAEDDKEDDDSLSANVIMQLFSPIVTSQRVMATQFGNSYTSIHCKDGTNLVFDEYMGFLFTLISKEKVHSMKRSLSVFISLVRHLCGPDVGVLRTDLACNDLLGDCLDNWHELRQREQSLFVEAVEQLAVNGDITTAALTALRDSCNSLKSSLNYSRSHSLIFVQEKLLALYTSRFICSPFGLSDMELAMIVTHNSSSFPAESEINVNDDSTSINNSPNQSAAEKDSSGNTPLSSRIVFLKGKKGFRPHALHIVTISDGIHFILIYQINSESLCSGLYDAFHHLTNFQKALESETDSDKEKKSFESLESTFKRIVDSLKKNKNNLKDVEGAVKTLTSRWDILKKKHAERLKAGDRDHNNGNVSMSANCSNLLNALRDVYQSICYCSTDLKKSELTVSEIADKVKSSLHAFSSFLTAKAFRNFTLRSRALLSINKYLEEFPGLVHFLYIDRVDHRLTAPSLDFSSEETNNLTKIKIWDMIEFSRRHLEDGHLAFMWKDTTFNYAYYLWFEDDQGSPIKPKICPANAIKSLPIPGILGEDFYQHLVEACFPKSNVQKIHCFELYCIHLGLATSSCVLDQSRRIAATVWEVTGHPKNPSDYI
ncbi:hypothetical protein LSTR_LSTR008697 [Laodelphax striatellus]|uniref:FUZ/MON1/HPS1 third Longin domain-containing protein n=1 Tax=Laodelphax striatellus TaxID=195883 RepID=A0A482WHK1_LAOST|nr:hypothetical protein LSTR_LSTR008697 [Laodelphax striatellus]